MSHPDNHKAQLRYEGHDEKVDAPLDEDGLSVLDLLAEMREQGEKESADWLLRAERNESFVNGDQNRDLDRYGSFVDIKYNEAIPAISHNLMRNLVLAWTSRILKDRPTVKAWPATDEPTDVAAAMVATSIWESFEYENDFDHLLTQVLRQACPHGTGGVKCYYDPEIDMVVWQQLTIFDYFIDPQQHLEDARWVCFKNYIPRIEAKAILKNRIKAKIDDEDIVEEEYEAGRLKRSGVPVWELWHLPTARIPNGLFATIVGGHVVEKLDYPYLFEQQVTPAEPMVDPDTGMPIFDKKGNPKMSEEKRSGGYGMLPISIFKVDDYRNSPYGDTWVNDAVQLQKLINENESMLAKIKRDFGSVKMTSMKKQAEAIESDNQIIIVNDPEEKNALGYLQPPNINPLLFSDREKLEQRLYDIAGLNELLAGVESTKSGTSAKQIAYLSELDAMKHSGTAKNIEAFIKRLAILTLNLAAKYYKLPRIVKIVGEDEKLQAITFVGSDISGTDIRLEPRTGIDRFKAQQQQNKKEEALQGLRKPDQAMAEGELGVDTTQDELHSIQMVRQQVEALMQGQQQQPLPPHLVQPQAAVHVLDEQYHLLRGRLADPRILMQIMDLRHAYQQMLMQQNPQHGQPGGGPGAHAKGAMSTEQRFAKDEQAMRGQK